MSVPTWKRKQSSVEYLHKTYKLAIDIGGIVNNKPKKYKPNYGDALIKASLSALKHCQIANSIFVHPNMSEDDFILRRKHLIEARGNVDHIATVGYIFLELCRKCDGIDHEKITRQEMRIGDICTDCHNLISGVIKSDKERFKQKK